MQLWSVAKGDPELTVLLEDGSIKRWDGSAWHVLAPPVSFGAEPVYGFAAGPGGEYWVFSQHWAQRFDGTWGEREQVTEMVSTAMEVDALGTVWIVSLNAGLFRRTAAGWEQIEELGIAGSFDTSFRGVVPDDLGGAWVGGQGDVLFHFGPDGARPIPLPPGVEETGGLLPEHHPDGVRLLMVSGRGLWRLGGSGWTRVEVGEREWAVEGVTSWWLASRGGAEGPGGASWSEAELPQLPTRQLFRQFYAPGGRVFAVGRDARQELFEALPGKAPPLVEATANWGLATVAESASVTVGDVDGDGREDLVTTKDQGRVHLLLQRDRSFSDVTDAIGLELAFQNDQRQVVLCDLDGSGRLDFLARAEVEGDSQTTRFFYLRNHGDWVEDVSDRGGFDPIAGEAEAGTGTLRCADVDGDGDMDLVLAREMQERSGPGGVALYLNEGHGHLRRVPLALRGLGAAGRWASHVLVEDLDRDGRNDFLVLSNWGGGFQLLHQRPDGRLEDRTAGTGWDGLYATPRRVYLERIDGDEWLDLLVDDSYAGVRSWKGGPALRFTDSTDLWGLRDHAAARSSQTPPSSALDDLDGDGRPDLFDCPEGQPCSLFVGSDAGGFTDMSRAVPLATSDVLDVVSIDLGADGDRDLLLLREGEDRILENWSVELGLATAPAVRRAPARDLGFVRRLVWLRPARDLPCLLLVLAAWLATHGVTRRRGSRWLLGARSTGLAVAIGAGLTFVAASEAPGLERLGFAALLTVAAPCVGWIEVKLHEYRSARTVAGYRLEAELGRGGMGVVYRARDLATGARVALKLVNPEILARDEDRVIFHKEADIGSRIDDPRVVRLLAWGEWNVMEAGLIRPTAYLVMELLDGVPLSAVVQLHGALPVGAACRIALEVAQALERVHGAGIVHRDIKPGNVMLVQDGHVKVMDFGAARSLSATTSTGDAVLGTLPYAGPEQARGEPADVRSDIYSLGVMLYELLAGVRPFPANEMLPLLFSILNNPAPPLEEHRPELPAGLRAAVMRALAKDPIDRFQSAAGFAAAIAPYAESGSISLAGETGPPRRSGPVTSTLPGREMAGPTLASGASSQPGTGVGLLASLVRHWIRYVRAGGTLEPVAFAESLLRTHADGSSEYGSRHELAGRLLEMAKELEDQDETAWVGDIEATL